MQKPGRPKKNKLLTSLKVRTWFNAVALASGMSAYELERQFSPDYLANDKNYPKLRPRLWEKYKLGKIEPSSKPIKGNLKSIAERVEDVYPGTIRWLKSPIWKLADFDTSISMEEIRGIYYSLDFSINKYLVYQNLPSKKNIFWRNQAKSETDVIREIYNIGSIDSIVALLGLIREASLIQNSKLFQETNFALITLLEKKSREPIDASLIKLRLHVIKHFTSTWLPSLDVGHYKPIYDHKVKEFYDGGLR